MPYKRKYARKIELVSSVVVCRSYFMYICAGGSQGDTIQIVLIPLETRSVLTSQTDCTDIHRLMFFSKLVQASRIMSTRPVWASKYHSVRAWVAVNQRTHSVHN